MDIGTLVGGILLVTLLLAGGILVLCMVIISWVGYLPELKSKENSKLEKFIVVMLIFAITMLGSVIAFACLAPPIVYLWKWLNR